MQVKLCKADGHLGPLGCAKFFLNRRKDVGIRPQNIKNFHFLVNNRLARANPFIDFYNFEGFRTPLYGASILRI